MNKLATRTKNRKKKKKKKKKKKTLKRLLLNQWMDFEMIPHECFLDDSTKIA